MPVTARPRAGLPCPPPAAKSRSSPSQAPTNQWDSVSCASDPVEANNSTTIPTSQRTADRRAIEPPRRSRPIIPEVQYYAVRRDASMLDLVIKNGMVIDGSGMPRYPADIGVKHGRIATIGRIRERAREVIDADGQVVSPGFIDGHTHMDAQIFWDPLGTCSCWHGITTVALGNFGFPPAPCAEPDKLRVIKNLQRAEDISPEAMEAGIKWTWTTYPEFLDVLDGLPKGINYSGYVGHSAIRTFVMGERAFEEQATEEDLAAMCRHVRDAIRAGAMGFTTSRSPSHETPERRPVASRVAAWEEIRRLVGVMGEMNAGIFEIAAEGVSRHLRDPDGLKDYHRRLRDLAVETG